MGRSYQLDYNKTSPQDQNLAGAILLGRNVLSYKDPKGLSGSIPLASSLISFFFALGLSADLAAAFLGAAFLAAGFFAATFGTGFASLGSTIFLSSAIFPSTIVNEMPPLQVLLLRLRELG